MLPGATAHASRVSGIDPDRAELLPSVGESTTKRLPSKRAAKGLVLFPPSVCLQPDRPDRLRRRVTSDLPQQDRGEVRRRRSRSPSVRAMSCATLFAVRRAGEPARLRGPEPALPYEVSGRRRRAAARRRSSRRRHADRQREAVGDTDVGEVRVHAAGLGPSSPAIALRRVRSRHGRRPVITRGRHRERARCTDVVGEGHRRGQLGAAKAHRRSRAGSGPSPRPRSSWPRPPRLHPQRAA